LKIGGRGTDAKVLNSGWQKNGRCIDHLSLGNSGQPWRTFESFLAGVTKTKCSEPD
jgi:hypothetical protein